MGSPPIWLTPAGNIGTFVQGKEATFTFSTVGSNDFTLQTPAANIPGFFNFYINTATQATGFTTMEIRGTPYVYNEDVTVSFVLRCSNEFGVNDRTFTMTVTGPTDPIWITPGGYLQVGPKSEPYCLNKNRVDILLQAQPSNGVIPLGNRLTYYIADGDGSLPPGLKLNGATGLINGYVNDNLTLDFQASKSGGYDDEAYDAYPYDHVVVFNNNPDGVPTSISKIYTFYVTVTDGVSIARQQFKIRVEDPNEFRADTTQIDSTTTDFLADIGYLQTPAWVAADGSLLPNPANLGTIRANNNHEIDLTVFDPYPFVGPVSFDWDLIQVNPEIRIYTDSQINEIFFPTTNLTGQTQIYASIATGTPLIGMQVQLAPYVAVSNAKVYNIVNVEKYGDTGYILDLDGPLLFDIPNKTNLYVGTPSVKPPGINLNPDTGLLYGKIPYQPAYSTTYRFTVRITKSDYETSDTVSDNQIFNLTVKGDVENPISWVSPTDLGYIQPGYVSNLQVVAEHATDGLDIVYNLTGGKLPPGLTLTQQGNITGSVPYDIQTNFDATTLGFGSTTFDLGRTTFDKQFTFNVTARDSYLLSAVSKDFTLEIQEQSIIPYTEIYVSPLLSPVQRSSFKALVDNPVIFDNSLIYRLDDPNFGVQNKIKMTIEYGIEQIDIDAYTPALTNYFQRKRYYFGDIKSAQAIDDSGNILYDVVYVDIIDDQMTGNKISAGPSFTQTVNGSVVTYYPDSVINEQNALQSIVLSANQLISVDDRLRPQFMQTLQASTGTPLGFVKAFILCYTIPNRSTDIITNIKNSGFDFKTIDFDIDRITFTDAITARTVANTIEIGDGLGIGQSATIDLTDVSGLVVGMKCIFKGVPADTYITNVNIAYSQISISSPVQTRILNGNTINFNLGVKQLVFGLSAAQGGGISSSFYLDTESYNPALDPNPNDALIADTDIDTEDGNPLSL
jgi:hypothetical protein